MVKGVARGAMMETRSETHELMKVEDLARRTQQRRDRPQRVVCTSVQVDVHARAEKAAAAAKLQARPQHASGKSNNSGCFGAKIRARAPAPRPHRRAQSRIARSVPPFHPGSTRSRLANPAGSPRLERARPRALAARPFKKKQPPLHAQDGRALPGRRLLPPPRRGVLIRGRVPPRPRRHPLADGPRRPLS